MTEPGKRPRLHNGRPLHHIGDGYLVLLDNQGQEVSQRATGTAWIGFLDPPGPPQVIFLPDHTDKFGDVTLNAEGPVAWVALGIVGDGIVTRDPGTAAAGQTVSVKWDSMLDRMH